MLKQMVPTFVGHFREHSKGSGMSVMLPTAG